MKKKGIAFKAAGATGETTDAQLSAVNRYALKPLSAADVYTRKFLIAHNAIDRDEERFNEDLLEEFARSLPGKGFFVQGHPSSWAGTGAPGRGRFFAAETEEMSAAAFTELTGEIPRLPAGIDLVKVLWGHAYMPKLESNADTIANIDAGIYSFVSLGYKAGSRPVMDEKGNRLYDELIQPGEAYEGSLVWLGAQPGAAAKDAKDDTDDVLGSHIPAQHDPIHDAKNKGGDLMKDLLKRLEKVFNKTFAEETAADEVERLIVEQSTRVKTLEADAADGRAYRKALIDDALRFGAMIGEVKTDGESQTKEAEFVATWPIERIKDLRDRYEVKARTQFPDKFQIVTKDESDRAAREAEAARAAAAAGGRKDYTTPDYNELFGTLAR